MCMYILAYIYPITKCTFVYSSIHTNLHSYIYTCVFVSVGKGFFYCRSKQMCYLHLKVWIKKYKNAESYSLPYCFKVNKVTF